MATTFIYALCEPGTRTVRYIGKADKPERRLQNHLSASRKSKSYLGNWLRSLGVIRPSLVVLQKVPVEQWELAEERYIRLARGLGMRLTNGTDGGDGGYNPAAHSPEARAKMRASMKGRRPADATLEASQTEVARAKRSETLRSLHLGQGNPDAHIQQKRVGASSNFLGVSWHKLKCNWQSRIVTGGQAEFLGYFTSETSAARAYDAAAVRVFGPTATLNFTV